MACAHKGPRVVSGLLTGALGALAIVATPSALLGACGSFNAAAYGVEGDGGAEGDGAPAALPDGALVAAPDSGGNPDAGAEEDASPGLTSVLAVHASANLYDYRLCFGVTSGGVSAILPVPAYPDDPAHPMPETNYPGVPVGGATLLPPLALPGSVVTPYVLRAQELDKLGYLSTSATEPTCDQLICSGASCLTAQLDYFPLPPVTLPAAGGGAIVLAVTGCVASSVSPGSIEQCGASYLAATGNLGALVGALAPSDDAGAWTMQLAVLSPSFSVDAGASALTYVDPSIDASFPLSVPIATVSPAPTAIRLSDAGVATAYFAIGGGPSALTESLAAIQYFQSPSSNPFTYFGAPVTYFTAIVGDATDAAAPVSLPDGAPNPAFDGHGLHVISYPE